ncbi:hypothetical protein IG631_23315 [Alternaria alternata]|nr:hypothetical protein IG631_23315 [Alternaria alternata]
MERAVGPRIANLSPSSSRPISRRHSDQEFLAPKAKGLNPWALGVNTVEVSLDITSPLSPSICWSVTTHYAPA